jgi:hypothetical protein
VCIFLVSHKFEPRLTAQSLVATATAQERAARGHTVDVFSGSEGIEAGVARLVGTSRARIRDETARLLIGSAACLDPDVRD